MARKIHFDHIVYTSREALKAGDIESALRRHFEGVAMAERGIREPHRIYVSLRNSMQFCLWRKYAAMK